VTLAVGVALVYLGVFSTLVAYLLYFSLLERHSAIELTLVTYLVPLVAAAAGLATVGRVNFGIDSTRRRRH
jgi:drug/metabolite transporter (DMT)-like permease